MKVSCFNSAAPSAYLPQSTTCTSPAAQDRDCHALVPSRQPRGEIQVLIATPALGCLSLSCGVAQRVDVLARKASRYEPTAAHQTPHRPPSQRNTEDTHLRISAHMKGTCSAIPDLFISRLIRVASSRSAFGEGHSCHEAGGTQQQQTQAPANSNTHCGREEG
jgi:hypothetical protein